MKSQPGDYKIHTDETGRNTLMTVVRCQCIYEQLMFMLVNPKLDKIWNNSLTNEL